MTDSLEPVRRSGKTGTGKNNITTNRYLVTPNLRYYKRLVQGTSGTISLSGIASVVSIVTDTDRKMYYHFTCPSTVILTRGPSCSDFSGSETEVTPHLPYSGTPDRAAIKSTLYLKWTDGVEGDVEPKETRPHKGGTCTQGRRGGHKYDKRKGRGPPRREGV